MRKTRTRRRGCAALAALAGALLAHSPARAAAGGPSEALPGAPPLPEALRAEFAAELEARGSATVPRTRNLRDDGSPRFTNRLVLETSPYLQQHAHNPVNWFPWGDEAFAEAQRLGRPVLVSIGYSTCHWCHVMEEESFDDPSLAAYLNAHFIAVKVDREARPDVDAIYMAAIYALGKSGGWPLNVFVTPSRAPFYAGTYFPPEDRAGRLGFENVLRTIAEQYRQEPERIAEMSARISERIVQSLEGIAATASNIPDESALLAASLGMKARIDPTWGGSGRGNKFPSTVPIRFLLRMHRRTQDAETLRLVELTLEKMAAGGIQDHVGGGFHRYATDPRWLVPHFEKMLYDNALIALAYVEAFQATGRRDFEAVARRTLDYVAAEMMAPSGGFYSATDADSQTPSGERAEGWFFTWTPAEVAAVLGDADARVVSAWFGITAAGDVDGRSVLRTWRSADDVAAEFEMTPDAVRRSVERATPRLFAARSLRPAPLRDEKIITAWNGLMLSAFARAGFAFADPTYLRIAARTADFLLTTATRNGRLTRVHMKGRSDGPAFLEDYAFAIAGLLDLSETGTDPRWLRGAIDLQATLDAHYLDETGGGYLKTPDDHERLLAREKPNDDGAVPSGNSLAAQNLVRLAELTSNPAYEATVVLLFSAFHEVLSDAPIRVPEMLLALDLFLGGTPEIVLVRPRDGAGAEAMTAVLRTTYAPNRVVAMVTEGNDADAWAQLVPLVRNKRAQQELTTAYVCEDRVCKYPTTDPAVFARQLQAGDDPP